jgi:TonB-dependent receptor
VLNRADTAQREPDHRFMNYFRDAEGRPRLGDAGLPVPQYPSRYFRDITEESWNGRLDWTLPFRFASRESRLKFGGFYSAAERDFREQYFGYTGVNGFDVANPNSYLNDPAFLGYEAVWLGGIRTNFNFARTINLAVGRPYTAASWITAGYLMADMALLPWLRGVGGARLERTEMEIDALREGRSRLEQTDLLPAAGAIVSLTTNLTLRLSYAETVARPSFREKSPILNYLPDRKVFARGNPDLQMSAIRSYDARLEWFPAPGELFSLGVFLKKLRRPIELYQVQLDGDDITWINRDAATVHGLEFEARKSLRALSPCLEGLTLGLNAAWIHSETRLTDVEYRNKSDVDGDGVVDFPTSRTRPLYDQSPYIINVDLTYDQPAWGTTLTLAANLTGERIVLASAQGADQYEHPPVTLDFGLSQKIGRRLTARFGVRNLLDSEIRQTYGPKSGDPLYQSYRRGRTFSLSLSAEF